MRHSANLDILRSVAVSAVLADHLLLTLLFHQGVFNITPLEEYVFNLSQAGVLAFFVHTSLVLMYSLERMTRNVGRVALRFYVRRFFRIYPLSVFCIILAIVFHVPSDTWGGASNVTAYTALSNLLLVQNFIWKGNVLASLWSLPYEVQMYLVLPALYLLTLKRWAVTCLSGLYLSFCFCLFLYHWKLINYIGNAEYVPCFLCGVLCYSLRNRIKARVPAFLWLPLVLALILLYCVAGGSKGTQNFWVGWVFCLILGLAINHFHDSSQKYVNLAAERMALYSYGVYLVHIPVLYLVFVVLHITNWTLGSLMSLALTFAGSAITYHLIESPFIDLGRKLSSGRRDAATQVPARGTVEPLTECPIKAGTFSGE
jgi:peptidoglycan/LPS O-acetylase OafA/YrhL